MTVLTSEQICVTNDPNYFALLTKNIRETIFKLLRGQSNDWAVRIRLESEGEVYYEFRLAGIDSITSQRTTKAMMNVLNHFHDNTHIDDPETIISDIIVLDEEQVSKGRKSQNALIPHDCYEFQTLRSLESWESIPPDLVEWVEKEYNYTPIIGGIKVPYHSTIIMNGSGAEDGCIKIAFANKYQALNGPICIALLKAVQNGIRIIQPDTNHQYTLSELQIDPILNCHLAISDITNYA